MRLIIDTDAVIKLNRAETLQVVVHAHVCVITSAVYEEAVNEGKKYGYHDATEIEKILEAGAVLLMNEFTATTGDALGPGEQSILAILDDEPQAIVVSDDQRFLKELSSKGVSSLTPPDLVVLLAEDGVLTLDDARAALDKMSAVIDEDSHSDATEKIEMLRREREQ